MLKKLLTGASPVAIAAAFSAGTAFAAGLDTPAYHGDNFTGAYLGGFVGLQDNQFDHNRDDDQRGEGNDDFVAVPKDDIDGTGGLVGARMGAGMQSGKWYAGVDLMAAYSGYYQDTPFIRLATENPRLSTSTHAALSVTALGAAQARLGMVFDDILVYVSGGAGYVDATYCSSTSESDQACASNRSGGQENSDFSTFAPVLGGGAVWKPSPNWSFSVNAAHFFTEEDRLHIWGGFDGANQEINNGLEDRSELESITTVDATISLHLQ